jgi:hypothetical protein
MLTLKVVVPIFVLYAVAQIVVTIVQVQFSKNSSYNADDGQIFNLTIHAMYGVFHVAVMAVLVYFFTVPHLWESPFSQPYFITPAATPAATRPNFQGHGEVPPIQFDGHLGFAAHPQQYDAPQSPTTYFPDNRYSQGSNFNSYPQPQVAPLRSSYHGERVASSMPHSHSSRMSPPSTS